MSWVISAERYRGVAMHPRWAAAASERPGPGGREAASAQRCSLRLRRPGGPLRLPKLFPSPVFSFFPPILRTPSWSPDRLHSPANNSVWFLYNSNFTRYNEEDTAMNMYRELRGDIMNADGKMPPSLPAPFPRWFQKKASRMPFFGAELIPNIWYTNLASLEETNFSRVIQLKDF